MFQQLFELRSRGFCKLNHALLMLMSKCVDTGELHDYCPICLIYIMAKIFTKALSLLLSLKLDLLVSRNQNVFIIERSLHDNFVLVRQSLQLLHQLGAPRVMLKEIQSHRNMSVDKEGSGTASSSGLLSSCPPPALAS